MLSTETNQQHTYTLFNLFIKIYCIFVYVQSSKRHEVNNDVELKRRELNMTILNDSQQIDDSIDESISATQHREEPIEYPMFYNDLVPLNSSEHADWKMKGTSDYKFAAKQHAIPLTIDEFVDAARNYPIVFSPSDKPVPMALMGLNDGSNVFIDDDGLFEENVHVPAYIQRYPFFLAKLTPDADELTLCFDPTCNNIGEFDEGDPLFEKGQITDITKGILEFCEQFDQAVQRTRQFMDELERLDLLMDGEITIEEKGCEDSSVYRGFKMVDEDKLRKLDSTDLEALMANGALLLIYAHLSSLDSLRVIFAKQVEAGFVPTSEAA